MSSMRTMHAQKMGFNHGPCAKQLWQGAPAREQKTGTDSRGLGPQGASQQQLHSINSFLSISNCVEGSAVEPLSRQCRGCRGCRGCQARTLTPTEHGVRKTCVEGVEGMSRPSVEICVEVSRPGLRPSAI